MKNAAICREKSKYRPSRLLNDQKSVSIVDSNIFSNTLGDIFSSIILKINNKLQIYKIFFNIVILKVSTFKVSKNKFIFVNFYKFMHY